MRYNFARIQQTPKGDTGDGSGDRRPRVAHRGNRAIGVTSGGKCARVLGTIGPRRPPGGVVAASSLTRRPCTVRLTRSLRPRLGRVRADVLHPSRSSAPDLGEARLLYAQLWLAKPPAIRPAAPAAMDQPGLLQDELDEALGQRHVVIAPGEAIEVPNVPAGKPLAIELQDALDFGAGALRREGLSGHRSFRHRPARLVPRSPAPDRPCTIGISLVTDGGNAARG